MVLQIPISRGIAAIAWHDVALLSIKSGIYISLLRNMQKDKRSIAQLVERWTVKAYSPNDDW